MRKRSPLLIIVLMVLICCLSAAACSSGTAEPEKTTTAGQPQSIPEHTTEGAETGPVKTTEAETQESVPIVTESAPEQSETEPEEADWRDKYEALPADLQEALIPADVQSADDFLTMTAGTLDGEQWSGAELADYDMTVMDCWMTWCGPCRDEMPTLQKVFMELPDNINMMGICFDGKAETATCKTIVTQCGVTYNVLLGDDVTGSPFYLGNYTQGVPTLLFVDAQGHCFARFVGRPLTDAIAEKDALNIIINLALEKLKGE